MEPGVNTNRLKSIFLFLTITGGYVVFFGLGMLFPGRSFCIFKSLTGFPCPGCGMGTATLHLAHGSLFQSISVHPLAIPFNLIVVMALVWILRDVIKRDYSFLPWLKKQKNPWIFIPAILIVLITWLIHINKTFH